MENILGTKEFNDLASQMFGGKPKQETLEEAAKKYSGIAYNREDYEEKYYNQQGCDKYDAFIDGIKWEQEQILNFLYEEITERREYSSSKMCEEVIKFIKRFE
jgi:hypothetical protein